MAVLQLLVRVTLCSAASSLLLLVLWLQLLLLLLLQLLLLLRQSNYSISITRTCASKVLSLWLQCQKKSPMRFNVKTKVQCGSMTKKKSNVTMLCDHYCSVASLLLLVLWLQLLLLLLLQLLLLLRQSNYSISITRTCASKVLSLWLQCQKKSPMRFNVKTKVQCGSMTKKKSNVTMLCDHYCFLPPLLPCRG